MLTVAPGGNNLATICYKYFLGLATINMYYYYYYYYYYHDLLYVVPRVRVSRRTLQCRVRHLTPTYAMTNELQP